MATTWYSLGSHLPRKQGQRASFSSLQRHPGVRSQLTRAALGTFSLGSLDAAGHRKGLAGLHGWRRNASRSESGRRGPTSTSQIQHIAPSAHHPNHPTRIHCRPIRSHAKPPQKTLRDEYDKAALHLARCLGFSPLHGGDCALDTPCSPRTTTPPTTGRRRPRTMTELTTTAPAVAFKEHVSCIATAMLAPCFSTLAPSSCQPCTGPSPSSGSRASTRRSWPRQTCTPTSA